MSVSSIRSEPVPSAPLVDHAQVIPPLQNGDRLTRQEFVRRYEATPWLKKAELSARST